MARLFMIIVAPRHAKVPFELFNVLQLCTLVYHLLVGRSGSRKLRREAYSGELS